jgi:DDE family transposase
MAHPAGETNDVALRVDFDRRLLLQFRGSVVTSDAGLLAYRELDDALGLSAMAGDVLADARTGRNGRHALVGMLRQSLFGRLAGYEDVNDAERLRHDPAMRWIVGGKVALGRAASPSQMGRFETTWLTTGKNLSALTDLSGQWIDSVHARRPPRGILLDMDSSVSPTHGEQENSVWNGHYDCTCYHPLFVFNQVGDLERCALRPGNVHSADGWEGASSAEHASNGSRKARARSNGRGCHVGRSPPTPSVSSFMRWPTISAISCALWRRRSRSRSHGEVDSDRRSGRVRLRPPTLETTMQTVADRPEAPNAIRNDLGRYSSRWNSVVQPG